MTHPVREDYYRHTYTSKDQGTIAFIRSGGKSIDCTINRGSYYVRSIHLGDENRPDITLNVGDALKKVQKQWDDNNPFTAFLAFDLSKMKSVGLKIGTIGLFSTNDPGVAELNCLEGSECKSDFILTKKAIVSTIVRDFSIATIQEGYKIEGVPLKTIQVSIGNGVPATANELEKLGMQLNPEKSTDSTQVYSVDVARFADRGLRFESNRI